MKLSFVTLLLVALLPLVLASEPANTSWWNRFWPFKSPQPDAEPSSPLPETLPVTKVDPPITTSDEKWYSEHNRRHNPAPSDTTPKEGTSGDASNPANVQTSGQTEKPSFGSRIKGLFSKIPKLWKSKNPETSASGAESSHHNDINGKSKNAFPAPDDASGSSNDQITQSLPKDVETDNPSKLKSVYSTIKTAASHAKNACAFGIKCVTGMFGRKDKQEEEKSDHTTDHVDTYPISHTNPPDHPHSIHNVKPLKTKSPSKRGKWAERIMQLPLHERFMLFRSGRSHNRKSGKAPGVLHKVGQFCKNVLTSIVDIPKKLGQKIVSHFRGPKAPESAETTN